MTATRGAPGGGLARSTLGLLLQIALGAALAAAVGLGLGWLSRTFFIVGLVPILTGVVAGAGIAFVALLVGGPWRWPARVAALLAVACGWLAFQTLEDHHFRRQYQEGLALVRSADTGAPPGAQFTEEELAFLASDSDELLERQVAADVGQGGWFGRWLYRSEAGIRLIGSFEHSRGLAVGRIGAFAWTFVELLAAWGVALLVLGRVRGRAAKADAPA